MPAALSKAAGEKHQRHQPNAVGRCPEMQFDQRPIAPLASNQSRHDVYIEPKITIVENA